MAKNKKRSRIDKATFDYIRMLENPGNVGYKDGIWRPPTDSTKYDIHQIGPGLDMREEHNPYVYNYLKSHGRLDDPWLTDAEVFDLVNQTWDSKAALYDSLINQYGDKISERGRQVLAAMAWHGHPFKMVNSPDSITGKAFINALATGDRDLDTVFDAYYKYPANEKKYAAKIAADLKFRHPRGIAVSTDDTGNKTIKVGREFWNTPEELTPYNQTPELVKYWMNYKDPTQYPIVNKTPQYLSSTNAADAPNGRITGPSLIRDIHNQDIMNREAVRDAFERGATVWGNKNYLPSLSEVMQNDVKDYAKDIMFANPFYGSEIEYKPLKYKKGKDTDSTSVDAGAKIGAAIDKLYAGYSLAGANSYALPYLKSYLKSEGFKNRLERTKNTELKEYVNSVYDTHPNFPYNRNYHAPLKEVFSVMAKDDPAWIDNGYFEPWTVFVGPQSKNDYDTVSAHEFGHAMDTAIIANTGENYSMTLPTLRKNKEYQKNLNFYANKKMNDSVAKWLKDPYSFPYEIHHDAMPGESYADLVATRYWMNKIGLFDSRDKDAIFTESDYDKIKNIKDIPFNVKRFFDNFSKEDYIKAINDIAYNNTKNDTLYAKRGKDLPTFGDGKRMLYDDQTGKWNRVTDDQYADVFSNFSASPNGGIKENNAKSHYETDNTEYAINLRDRLSNKEGLKKIGEKPIESGLEQPLIDPFVAALTGGRLAGDVIGDIVGDATNRLIGKAAPVLYKGINDLYLKSLEKQAASVPSSNKPFFVFHGTPKRGIKSNELRNYSEFDTGLHLTRDKRVAEDFEIKNGSSTPGMIHEGVDYGIYPDALYGDFGSWNAPSWINHYDSSVPDGFVYTGIKSPRLLSVQKADAETSARDLIRHFGLDPSEIRKLVGADSKDFAKYLRSHHVNFEYLNAIEGSAERASKYPSIFISDPSDIKFAKKILYGPNLEYRPFEIPTAYVDWKSGNIKFPEWKDVKPLDEPLTEIDRTFKRGKDLPKFGGGKVPRTTSGPFMPTPVYNTTPTPNNVASRYLEEYADLLPYVGSIMEWQQVANGDITNVPSATISTIADMFLPSVVKGYKKAGAISRLAKSTGRKTKQMIDNAYKEAKEGAKEFKSALAYQLVGAWEDILDHTK